MEYFIFGVIIITLSLMCIVKPHTILYIILSIVLFQDVFAKYVPDPYSIYFTNFDEVLIIICLAIITIMRLKLGKLNMNSTDKLVLILLLIYFIIGTVSAVINGISVKTYLIGGYLAVKVFLVYLIFSLTDWTVEKIKKYLFCLAVLFCMIALYGLAAVVVKPLRLFDIPIEYYRVGIEPAMSVFSHPGRFATIMTYLTLFSLGMYLVTSRKYLLGMMVLGTACIILSLRFKSVIGVIAAVVFVMIFQFKKVKANKNYFPLILVFGFIAMIKWNSIVDIVTTQLNRYFLNSNLLAVQRWALYYYGFRIMLDYFPFGSGFGTYASWMSRVNYSSIYYKYGLNQLFGLSESFGHFINDTYWPSVIGECGVFGLISVLIILYSMLKQNLRAFDMLEDKFLKGFILASTLCFVGIFIESFATSIYVHYRSYYAFAGCGIVASICKNSEVKSE